MERVTHALRLNTTLRPNVYSSVNTPASYTEGPGYRSRPRDRVS
jgi:hypothetical protein